MSSRVYFLIPFSAQHPPHRGDGTHFENGPLSTYHYDIRVEFSYQSFVKIEDVKDHIRELLAPYENKPLLHEQRTLEGLSRWLFEAARNSPGKIERVEVYEPQLGFGAYFEGNENA